MSDNSTIPWLHFPGTIGSTWNPIGGCSKIATGCKNCYAIRVAHRLAGNPNEKIRKRYEGLTVMTDHGLDWTGKVRLFDDDALTIPLRAKKPRTYFLSLSDLFHEDFQDEVIDRVFAVMALAYWHRFIILTKRGKRMWEYTAAFTDDSVASGRVADILYRWPRFNPRARLPKHVDVDSEHSLRWPLPNVILGVSGSTQQDLDRELPELLRTPAACRLLSLEPQTEDVDLRAYLPRRLALSEIPGWALNDGCTEMRTTGLDWVIQGFESGPGAREGKIEWARHTRDQCKTAGVPYFLKQLGFWPHDFFPFNDRKGEDPAEWPEDLQNCRAFPLEVAA